MQAMIFAAGLGTRLKPLTDTMPKALVKVGGRTLLEHTVTRLKDAGAERIVVNVHHFASQITDFLRANNNFGIDIRVSDESSALLDTGGGMRKAAPLFDPTEPILIHNVDIMSNVDLRRFYDDSLDADATLLVSKRRTKRYLLFEKRGIAAGCCEVQEGRPALVGWTNIETGEVRSPHAELDPSCCDMYAFSGIHVFAPRLFPLLDCFPEKFGIMDFYLRECACCDIRGCVKDDLRLMDVGKIETLDEAEAFAINL